VASSLQDAQALLDYYNGFNTGYPSIGNQSDDNFYLSSTRYNALDLTSRNNYLWTLDALNETEWNNLYKKTGECNNCTGDSGSDKKRYC